MNRKAWALSNAVRLLGNKLDNLGEEYDRLEANLQTIFRKFVIDKQFPLKDRFDVWSRHCIKEHSKVAIRSGDFGIIGELVAGEDDCYQKYITYDWEHFLELIADRNEYPGEYYGSINVTTDEIKEALITENFGSFVKDF